MSSSNWSVKEATLLVRSSLPSSNKPAKQAKPKFNFATAKKHSNTVKRHETNEDNVSESDSEGEYNDNNVVFDSDSDEEVTVIDERHLPEDKRRVLDFFNNGTDQELACIQGCSKKKVENIVELRPFEGWQDLIRKLQISKNLHTDMLNHTTVLIKMRDAVNRLMDKCEKITKRMETMVESLTHGDKKSMELMEQPKILNPSNKMTGYQMIG